MDNEILLKTEENINFVGIKSELPQTNSVTEEVSKDTPKASSPITIGGERVASAGNSKVHQSTILGDHQLSSSFDAGGGSASGAGGGGGGGGSAGGNGETSGTSQIKNKSKRKRRRGKPKGNSKPFKKSHWKFQMPQRYRNGLVPGSGLAHQCSTAAARKNLQRSLSLVPYNTNKFLMEEHMAEVPSALLTPSGRTRDSSFSVDSEDNYFFSLPEDEEEFLTKEFANVYERARVERLENMNKQQLIEECLQIEDRYSHFDVKQQQKFSTEFLSKIRFLEDKVRELSRENIELRRRYDTELMKSKITSSATQSQHNNNNIDNNTKPEPMSSSDCSEDTESDSSTSSSSSCSSSSASEYSAAFSPRSISVEPTDGIIEVSSDSPTEDNAMLSSNEQLDNHHGGEIEVNNLFSRHNGIMNGHGPPGHEPSIHNGLD